MDNGPIPVRIYRLRDWTTPSSKSILLSVRDIIPVDLQHENTLDMISCVCTYHDVGEMWQSPTWLSRHSWTPKTVPTCAWSLSVDPWFSSWIWEMLQPHATCGSPPSFIWRNKCCPQSYGGCFQLQGTWKSFNGPTILRCAHTNIIRLNRRNSMQEMQLRSLTFLIQSPKTRWVTVYSMEKEHVWCFRVGKLGHKDRQSCCTLIGKRNKDRLLDGQHQSHHLDLS